MNIIYARMSGYNWVSTPSDAVARELEKLGHKLTVLESIEYIPTGKYNFVWSPYESVTLLGDAISKKLGVPHYSHIEVLPPWRVVQNIDFYNYGLEQNDPEISLSQLQKTTPHYMKVGKIWKNAEIKSISNHCRVDFHHKLLGNIDNLLFRYPSIDIASIKKAKLMFNPKKENRIITVARATPIKRYDLLCKVMHKIKNKIKWTIIGDGPMLNKIEKLVNNPNVDIEILGPIWGWGRYYEIMKSKFMVYAMGGMPPIEAALLGAFPIVIENQPTNDLPEFDKFMKYNFANKKNINETYFPIYQYNQIEEMATKIDKKIDKFVDESLENSKIVEMFMAGKMNVTPSSVNAKQLISRMKTFLNE